jgi:hypothetical protein
MTATTETTQGTPAALTRVTPRRTTAGFISDASEGAIAAEKLRAAGCVLIVGSSRRT